MNLNGLDRIVETTLDSIEEQMLIHGGMGLEQVASLILALVGTMMFQIEHEHGSNDAEQLRLVLLESIENKVWEQLGDSQI